jgi:hypothetical protein
MALRPARTTRDRVAAALAPVLVASRWMRSPTTARAAIRTVSAVRDRAVGEDVAVAELAGAAHRATHFGRYDLAADLYGRAIQAGGDVGTMLRARRRLPGYVGTADPDIVENAIAAAFGAVGDGDPRIADRRVTPLATGRALDVDVVVRHHLSDGRTMIRKSFLSAEAPRELLAYQAGLLTSPDGNWRAPALYFAARDGGALWHLFFEDVGTTLRPRSEATMVIAARALGHMNGTYAGDPDLAARTPWIADRRRSPRLARPRWTDARLRGVVADEVRTLVRHTAAELVAQEEALSRAWAGLPRTFSHGDAVPNNVSVGSEPVLLFDWSSCGRSPVGTDLGYLLGLPGAPLSTSAIDRCREAYRGAMTAAAPGCAGDEDIEFGYRYRFVTLSLRNQLNLLPPARPDGRLARARDLVITTWDGRRRARVEANLIRICDEANALLALVR